MEIGMEWLRLGSRLGIVSSFPNLYLYFTHDMKVMNLRRSSKKLLKRPEIERG